MDNDSRLHLPPELLLIVAEHLEKSEIAVCLRICRMWHNTLLSSIWRDVELLPEGFQRNPTMNALGRHQHLVQSLVVQDTFPDIYCSLAQSFQAQNLDTMTVEFVFPDWTPEPFRFAQEFAAIPSLVHLNLLSIHPNKISWFLSSVHQFPLLGSLEITSTILDRECAFQLWTVLPQLESLALSEVFFPDMNAATEAMAATTCPRLSNLYLHLDHIKLSPLHQARLLLSCPALKTLQWYLNANEDSPLAFEHTQLNLILARAQLPELEAFYTEGNFLDTQIALVLKAMNTARSLRFTSNSFGLESFGALRPHLSTLKELSIQDCKAMTSAMVQTVLCSCPVLEMLMLDWMFAKDAVQNGKEWVCASSLRHLSISFRFAKNEMALQPQVFDKLAALTKLEIFMMNWRFDGPQEESGLRLNLQRGLGKLSSWRRLRHVFCLGDTSQVLGIDELCWILRQWPTLQQIDAFTVDLAPHDSLREELASRGLFKFVNTDR